MKLVWYRNNYVAYEYKNGKSWRSKPLGKTLDEATIRFSFLKRDMALDSAIDIGEIDKAVIIFQTKRQPDIIKDYSYCWNLRLKHFFGGHDLSYINQDSCKAYYREYKLKGCNDTTLRSDLQDFATMIFFYTGQNRKGYQGEQIRFWYPTAPEPEHYYLTKTELKKLLAACTSNHLRLFILLGITTGARKSAILQLTWMNVDFKNRKIDFGVGNFYKRRAVVPMNETIFNELNEAQKKTNSPYVITYCGEPIQDIKKSFKRAAVKAGLPKAHPHTLRHSAAVWMAQAGNDMEEIKQYLGHRRIDMTRNVYARYSPNYLQKAAKSLEL